MCVCVCARGGGPVGWDKIPIPSWEASLTDIKAFNNTPTCALLPGTTVLNAMGPTGLKKARIPNSSLSCLAPLYSLSPCWTSLHSQHSYSLCSIENPGQSDRPLSQHNQRSAISQFLSIISKTRPTVPLMARSYCPR